MKKAQAGELGKRNYLQYYGTRGVVVLLLIFAFLAVQEFVIKNAVTEITLTGGNIQPVSTVVAKKELGHIIGNNFKIKKILGKGGMGVVYQAVDITLERTVAIKKLREELLSSEEETESLLREARLGASLKHPNLVEILSIVKEEGQLYLVFEFIDGRSMRDLIKVEKRIPLERTKILIEHVAAALDYAHENKVIHRDVKPENVMVDSKGTAKIMDFGIAYQARKALARITRTGIPGTPPYMAPEQELGSASRAADVFSLGVCLYEMLTGELPFNGPNYLAQKLAMKFEPATKLVPGLPGEVDTVLRKVLAAEPQRRHGSAGEFARALRAV